MENVKNYLVDLSNGETVCVYVSDKSINENVLTRFAENVTNEKVLDCYEVPQDDLQYYYIEGRVWIDTAEKVEKVKMLARNIK